MEGYPRDHRFPSKQKKSLFHLRAPKAHIVQPQSLPLLREGSSPPNKGGSHPSRCCRSLSGTLNGFLFLLLTSARSSNFHNVLYFSAHCPTWVHVCYVYCSTQYTEREPHLSVIAIVHNSLLRLHHFLLLSIDHDLHNIQLIFVLRVGTETSAQPFLFFFLAVECWAK